MLAAYGAVDSRRSRKSICGLSMRTPAAVATFQASCAAECMLPCAASPTTCLTAWLPRAHKLGFLCRHRRAKVYAMEADVPVGA